MPRGPATLVAASVIITVVFCCKYKQIETVGVALGLCELSFVATMFWFHPSAADIVKGLFDTSHYGNKEYLQLIAANIGAVIMPWMIYFQQSAVVARRLTTQNDLAEERAQTLVGSCLTQLVMIG